MPLAGLTNSQLCWDVALAPTNWTELTILSHWINVLALAFTWSRGSKTCQIQSSVTVSEGGTYTHRSTTECSFHGTVCHSLVTQAATASPQAQTQPQLGKLRVEVGFATPPLKSACWSPGDIMNFKLVQTWGAIMFAGSRFPSHNVDLQLERFTEKPLGANCNHTQNPVTCSMRPPKWEWQTQEGRFTA